MIGERLRVARAKARKTLRDVAAECGVSAQAVKKYEDNICMPNSTAFLALCRCLDVSGEWLMDATPLTSTARTMRRKGDTQSIGSGRQSRSYAKPDTCPAIQNPKNSTARKEIPMSTVDSASDDRTANNSVRHNYRVLTDAEKAQMVELKDLGAAFLAKCDEIGQSREMSLAKTNAEQAVMWAVKHVTA